MATAFTATLLLAAHGCGGYGTPEVVETAIRSVYENPRPQDCYDRETQHFVDQIALRRFRGGRRGGRTSRQVCVVMMQASRAPTSVDISGVRVHGNVAYAHVTVAGGLFDSQHQTVRLLTQDGEWKRDAITAVRLDRLSYNRPFRRVIAGFGGPAHTRDCFLQGFARMSDAAVERAIVSADHGPFLALRSHCDAARRETHARGR
jgi:hypothetical protein